MASHATTINAVPASDGRQQGMYSSTEIGSKHQLPAACQRYRLCRLLVQARRGMRENGASTVSLADLF